MLIPVVSKYLRAHKRLVVPQLGAFLVKEPGVRVVFSELMKRDDGILRGLLREQGLGELEAAGEIDRFVFEVRHAVERGDEFALDGLGVMRPGPNGTLAFEYVPAPDTPDTTDAAVRQDGSEPGPENGPESPAAPAQAPSGKTAEAAKSAFPGDDVRMSLSPKMNPEPYVRGLQYGKPLKTTAAYHYVDRAPRRRFDRFLLVAVLAAAIAVAAIAFGYWREAREKRAEQQALQPIEQTAPDAIQADEHSNTPTE